jgi:signal transduction histidine kinase
MREDESKRPDEPTGDESGAKMSDEPAALGVDEHVAHLIEELKRRSNELEQANRELRRVSHYRSLFLARMSHELRTPLTSILGFTEILLEQEDLTESQRRFCQKIQDSGFQLQASLDQLVDLSRVEAGQTELFLQEFSLRETVRDTCSALARYAQKHHVRIAYEIAPEIATIVSDQGRLRQILYSFLAWCISRCKGGEQISIQATPIRPARLRIQFEDECAHVDHPAGVFEPKEGRGSGDLPNIDELGIIIGKRLIDIMGGTVVLKNRETAGVRITIELPARPIKE